VLEEIKVAKNALASLSAHTLRHWFASYLLLKAEKPLAEVSLLLGHRNPQTTETIYMHLSPEFVNLCITTDEIVQQFSNFEPWEV
jgi:integrase